jgi:tRNA A-37 threonylcarbamoyl transferase component Bud32
MEDAEAPSSAAGRTVGGHYLLEEALGRGGMAIVYRVRDTRTGRAFALKRGESRNSKKQRRNEALLAREYHTLCQIAHPCIIEVYDYGVDELGPYYVMELLDGSDLDASERLPWKEACALLRDVASSLAILHARGLLHRDVSTRNVRRTPDGRAKLIDFGAMSSMGVPKEIVGTPAFMAPEVLQMQTLDGRADLFSLGALGYRLLTGSHAYPVRRMRELRDAWRSRPQAPSRRVPEIPAALSDLVLQLLSLDRNARPQSAAEVLSRLCAIAELPLEEQRGVSHAYLTAPTLVGRERALVAVRKQLLSLGRGDGGALLVEGVPGSGRSRLLDACAIEAKLLGATVVRADAGDGAQGDFGVVRVLGHQLLALLPKEAAEAARLARNVLMCVLDELPHEEGASLSAVAPGRDLLIRELRDFVLACARKHRLLLAVDDFDHIDEPSMAVLAALAYKAERHPLIVALAIDRESNFAASPAQRLLRSVCTPITLEPLDEVQSEALIRAVFGDVPNLQLVAGRIHSLAQGNPRATMELAQHLVTTGIVRYRAGGFALPERLSESELPRTFLTTLQQRLERLSADARELCDILCITDGDAPGVESYLGLTSHRDPQRVYAALDELVAMRVIVADGERYRFSQRGFFAAVTTALTPAAAAPLHDRVAHWLAQTGGDVLRRAHHLLENGGKGDLEAIALLSNANLAQDHAPLSLLAKVAARAEQHRLSLRTVAHLRMALVIEAQAVPDLACFQANVQPILNQLDRDSGLALYRALEHLPPQERLTHALAKTHELYLSTPEDARGYPVAEAIAAFARLAALFHSVGLASLDLDMWKALPSLEPLVSLSPAFSVVERFGDASKAWVMGRFDRSVALYREVLARVEQPDRAGLQEAQHGRLLLGLHFLLGMRCGVMGMDEAEAHAQVLEADRRYRVNAWRVRQLMHLSRGDSDEARRCMRRAEVLQLQIGGEQYGVGSTFAVELMAPALIGDVIGLRAAVERVALLAARQPGWRAVRVYGEVRLRQLQGDAKGALEQLLASFELAPASRHWCFVPFATCHVALLSDLGRVEEACAVGRDYLALCQREELDTAVYGVQLGLAVSLALARGGHCEEGVALAERLIADLQRRQARTVMLGFAFETRARIALVMNDPPSFEHFAELCGGVYNLGKNAVLAARLARLLDEARTAKTNSIVPTARLQALTSEHSESEYATVYSRMEECADRADRARCALTILLQDLESFAGYLYGVNADALTLLSGLPEPEPEAGLDDWVRRCAAAEIAAAAGQADATVTGDDAEHSSAALPDRYLDGEGRRFKLILLFGKETGGSGDSEAPARLTALLALQVQGAESLPHGQLLQRLAGELLEHGDVEGVIVQDAGTETLDRG